MKKQLLDFFQCPVCSSSFLIGNHSQTDDIIAGFLICDQGHIFNIKNGVPILRADLMATGEEKPQKEDEEDFNLTPQKEKQECLEILVRSMTSFSKVTNERAKKNI